MLVRCDPEGTVRLRVERRPEGYRVELPGWMRFELAPSGELRSSERLAPLDDATAEATYEHYVAPLGEQLRGRLVLHASGVIIGGRCVAFLGISGAGKSTLAALLAERGHGVLGDDWIALDFSVEGQVTALPSSERIVRLRPGSLAAVRGPTRPDLLDDRGALELPTIDPAPLTRLFVLAEAESLRLEPLTKRDAVLAVASRLHRIDPTDGTLLRRELEQLDVLASLVPAMKLVYPRSFEHAPSLLDAIEGALA